MKRRIILLWVAFHLLIFFVFAQPLLQTIKGSVFDAETNYPLIGATVAVLDSGILKGATTDCDGRFKIEGVPVGRYNIQISYVGYEPFVIKEVILSSGKETVLGIGLHESVSEIEQVVVKSFSNKNEPINSMATVSAKQINMEEANRYAGGMDDPARLVSSYAGITYKVGNNSIVIRGNSPKGMLWRMEGVQISNPNHFGDYISLGGGAVTALSSQTMATSDFFTGAFPAEYSNALSGVFDINMRSGNIDKREHVFQAGLNGIDLASEGPFIKGRKSTYLFNYRYSTLGLLSPILPEEMGTLKYQDLSFKLNFVAKAGIFSLWGIGAHDYQGKPADRDTLEWDEYYARKEYETTITMGATGISYKKTLNSKTFVQSTLAFTENSIDWQQKKLDSSMTLLPKNVVSDYRWKYTLTGFVNHKFSAMHTNKTGLIINRLMYDMQIKNAADYGDPLITYVNQKSDTWLLQFYSQSKINIANKLLINAGIHTQILSLNNNYTLEPRLGLRWNILPMHSFSLAYGLHAQMEALQFYMVEKQTPDGEIMPNKNLDFNKSHHIVAGYNYQINENLNFKAEAYYQYLYHIPVVPNSPVSTINISEIWNFNDSLVNEGTGKNYGLDITVEKYLDKGYYGLFTASIFDSKYTGGDGIERNTKYNRNYVFNILAGKEWNTGVNKKNLFNINIRFSYLGGERIIPIDVDKTLLQGEIIEDIYRSYEKKLNDAPILCLSMNYRKNKPKYSSVWSFHIINALAHADFQEYDYNKDNHKIEEIKDMLIIPNISYKIEF
jgi:hypothetical protein